MYVFEISFLASHIETTVLSDGTYELIPESEEGDQEAQVNAAILTEDPDRSPRVNYMMSNQHRGTK